MKIGSIVVSHRGEDDVSAGRSLRGRLMQSILGSTGLKAVQLVLGTAVTILLARALGPEEYGVYAFALSLVTLLAIPAQMGLPTLVVREVAKYQAQERWNLLRGLLLRANQAVLVLSLLIGFAAAVVAWALARQATETQFATFAWALLLLPLLALGDLRGAALRGLRRVVQGQVPERLLRPGLLILLSGLVVLSRGELTAPSAMALHALAAAVAFLVGAVLLLRALPSETRKAAPSYASATWLRSVLPLSFLAGMQVINSQLDLVMLGFLGSKEEVGTYRVVVQGATLVGFTLAAANVVLAPHIAQLHAAGDRIRLQYMVTRGAQFVLLTALPVAGAFIVFGGPILALVFGGAYRAGDAALAILCLGQLVNAGAGSVALILNMTGYERDTAVGVATAALANFIFNLILIPRFGMEGAAAATALSLAAWNVLLCRQVYRRLGVQSSAIRFWPVTEKR